MTCHGAPAYTRILDVLRRSLRVRRPVNPGRLVEWPKQTHNELPSRHRLPMRGQGPEFFRAVHAVAPAFLPATGFRPDRANRRPQSAREFRVAAKDPAVFCPAVFAAA